MDRQRGQNLIYNKTNNAVRKKENGVFSVIYIVCIFVSLCAALFILFDYKRPERYEYLFVLPLMFIVFLVLNASNIKKFFYNFGLALLVVLEFIRLVIAPFFLALSGYPEIITMGVDVNTPKAILLMAYETVALAIAINIPVRIKKIRECSDKQYSLGIKRLHVIMAIYTGLLVVLCAITPQILLSHRTIIGLFTDETFTHMQLDKVIAAFTGSTFERYCLILSRLLLTPFRLLFPAYLIIVIRYKKIKHGKLLSIIISFFPFLLVSDVIAQSIYFTFFLLLLTMFMYNMRRKNLVLLFVLAGLAVALYFITRYVINMGTNDESFFENMARKFSAYFSGLNIVSGAYNYPIEWGNKFQYFVYEFIRAIPVHNLIGIDDAIVPSTFFNLTNNVFGQIPTTIGMGYYYLGPLFAPIFSVVTAYLAKYYGEKMRTETIPLFRLIYIFLSFILVLGIVMYNVSISFNAILQIILPLYIIAVIAFRYKKISPAKAIGLRKLS